jgi:hypothetical protein
MRLLLLQGQIPSLHQGARSDRESTRRVEITSTLQQNGVKRLCISDAAKTLAMIRLENIYLSQGI